ncbi:MAG: ATP-binding protein [Gemmatimonadaceae bacterium]
MAAYLSALMVCGMGAFSYLSFEHARTIITQAHRTLSVMDAVRTVDDRIRDAGDAARDVVGTGQGQYASAYVEASDGALRALVALRDISAPYPGLAPRVDSLGYFVHLRLAQLNDAVTIPREVTQAGRDQLLAAARSGDPDRKIGDLLNSITSAAQRADAETDADAHSNGVVVALLVIGIVLLAVLLALFVHLMHARNVRAQRRMAEEMESQAVQLQLQASELTVTNRELENATRELLRQTVEAERSETRLAGILGSATDAVVSFDDAERIVYFNAAARRLFGLEDVVIPGAHILTMISGRSVAPFEEHMLSARRSAHVGTPSPEVWDTLVVHPDGDEVPVEVSLAYTRTGKQGLFTAVLRDVTRQRQFEEELRQAQKMEAVGRLAGGIAHDFNNLLTVIGASSDFLLHDLRGHPASLSEDVREIKAATNRAASLTRQLLAFSRRQLVQPQTLDVNIVVREMETMLRRLIGEDTVLSTRYADDIGLVKLDRGQLEQVVVNLVVNARDAMPDGGTITVSTESGASQLGDASAQPLGCVTLAVTDSGVGMDEQTRARIFEPFFTTKEKGRGTGLGLSTVYGIVKACGGELAVESSVGRGTEFRLQFPCIEEEAGAPVAEPRSLHVARGYETVLVVEDEEPLRRLTRRILESRGYTVLDAENGSEAIHLMASSASRVDLLLSDVVMPGMSGRELAERLLPVYPWLRVLFMSGYTEDMMLHHRVAEMGIALVEKPFTGDTLAWAVRNRLDRSTETAGAV